MVEPADCVRKLIPLIDQGSSGSSFPSQQVDHVIVRNGGRVRNLFGVMDLAGAPKTHFRPDPSSHGYQMNLDYFDAQ